MPAFLIQHGDGRVEGNKTRQAHTTKTMRIINVMAHQMNS